MFRQLTIAILLAGCGAAPLHWPSPDAGHARAQCGFYLAAPFGECGCVEVLKSSPALDPAEVLVDGEPLPEAGWYLDDQRRVCLRWCGLRPQDGQTHTLEALMVPEGCTPFLVETAKGCHADDKPCPGCCAGGICDGPSRLDDDWPDDDRYVENDDQ